MTKDLEVFEDNVQRCMDRLAGVRVRPHLKTAKSPEVAGLLLKAGAAGVCVAKLSEAEVMLAAGIDDLLITTELVGPIKAQGLAELVSRRPAARIRVVVDSWEGAETLGAALTRELETLIDVNVGQDRCGVALQDARALADRVRGLEHLRLIGLQGYEGNLQHVRDPHDRRRLCYASMERLSVAVDDLRGGGIPSTLSPPAAPALPSSARCTTRSPRSSPGRSCSWTPTISTLAGCPIGRRRAQSRP